MIFNFFYEKNSFIMAIVRSLIISVVAFAVCMVDKSSERNSELNFQISVNPKLPLQVLPLPSDIALQMLSGLIFREEQGMKIILSQ